MRRSLITAGLILAATSAPLTAQDFEGVVTMKTQGSQAGEVTQMYKGTMVRTEMKGGAREGVMLLDMTAQQMTMLMPSEKMYMVMDLAAMAMMRKDTTTPKPPKITKVGTSETIAGHACDNYLIGDTQDTEVCAAKGLGFFMGGRGGPGGGPGGPGRGGPLAGLSQVSRELLAKEFKDGFFPLRMSKVEGEKKTPMMEVTSIEKKALDASLFKVPEGYTKMDMPMGMPGARP